MTKKQEFLVRACKHYILEIKLNQSVSFPSGSTAIADAVISKSKSDSKMWVFTDFPNLDDLNSLTEKGDGFSSWDNPSEGEKFDIESYREIFADWGLL